MFEELLSLVEKKKDKLSVSGKVVCAMVGPKFLDDIGFGWTQCDTLCCSQVESQFDYYTSDMRLAVMFKAYGSQEDMYLGDTVEDLEGEKFKFILIFDGSRLNAYALNESGEYVSVYHDTVEGNADKLDMLFKQVELGDDDCRYEYISSFTVTLTDEELIELIAKNSDSISKMLSEGFECSISEEQVKRCLCEKTVTAPVNETIVENEGSDEEKSSSLSLGEEDAYKRKIMELSDELAESKEKIEKLLEEREELIKKIDNLDGVELRRAKEMLDCIEDGEDVSKGYVAVINEELIQKETLETFVGTVLQILYREKLNEASDFIFDGERFNIKRSQNNNADMYLNGTGYDIDLSECTEADVMNKLRVIFSNFSDLVFLCKSVGRADVVAETEEETGSIEDATEDYVEEEPQEESSETESFDADANDYTEETTDEQSDFSDSEEGTSNEQSDLIDSEEASDDEESNEASYEESSEYGETEGAEENVQAEQSSKSLAEMFNDSEGDFEGGSSRSDETDDIYGDRFDSAWDSDDTVGEQEGNNEDLPDDAGEETGDSYYEGEEQGEAEGAWSGEDDETVEGEDETIIDAEENIIDGEESYVEEAGEDEEFDISGEEDEQPENDGYVEEQSEGGYDEEVQSESGYDEEQAEDEGQQDDGFEAQQDDGFEGYDEIDNFGDDYPDADDNMEYYVCIPMNDLIGLRDTKSHAFSEIRSLDYLYFNNGGNSEVYDVNANGSITDNNELLARCIDAVMARVIMYGRSNTMRELKKLDLASVCDMFLPLSGSTSYLPKVSNTKFVVSNVNSIYDIVTGIECICNLMNIDMSDMHFGMGVRVEVIEETSESWFINKQTLDDIVAGYFTDYPTNAVPSTGSAIIRANMYSCISVTKGSLEVQDRIIQGISEIKTKSQRAQIASMSDVADIIQDYVFTGLESGKIKSADDVGKVLGRNTLIISSNQNNVSSPIKVTSVDGVELYICGDMSEYEKLHAIIRTYTYIFKDGNLIVKIQVDNTALEYYMTRFNTADPVFALAVFSFTEYIRSILDEIKNK